MYFFISCDHWSCTVCSAVSSTVGNTMQEAGRLP